MTKKRRIIYSSLLAIFIIILLVVFIILPITIENKIKKELSKENIIPNYVVKYKDLRYYFFSSTIHIDSLSIVPKNVSRGMPMFIDFRTSNFQVSLKSPFSIFKKKKELELQLKLLNPKLSILHNTDITIPKLMSMENQNISISLSNLKIKNGSFSYKTTDNKTMHEFIIDNLNIDNIIIDEFLSSSKSPSLRVSDIKLSSINSHFKNSLYYNYVDRLYYNDKKKALTAHDINIAPKISYKRYFKHFKYQTDYYKAKIKNIEINRFDLSEIIEKRPLNIDYIKGNGLDLEVIRDMNYPNDISSERKTPIEQINSIPYPMSIDSIFFSSSNITYNEVIKDRRDLREIGLNQLDLKIKDIHNSSHIRHIKAKGESSLSIISSGKIMNKGKFHSLLEFPYQGKDIMKFSGTLDTINFYDFNPLLGEDSRIKIDSGLLISLNYNGVANRVASKGEVEFVYSGLNVELLNKKRSRDNELETYLINKIIRNSNPKEEDKEPIKSKIKFERDPHRSVYNYLWRSIYSGIKRTLGI